MNEKPENLDVVSASKIKLYNRCPLAYKFRYKDGLAGGEDRPDVKFGKLIHHCLAEAASYCLREKHIGTVPEYTLKFIFDAAVGKLSVTDKKEHSDAWDLLLGYSQLRHFDYTKIVGIERDFEVPVKQMRLTGRIDLVELDDEGRLTAVDYKTRRSIYTAEELKNDLQVTIYCYALYRLFPGVEDVSFKFDFVRLNEVQTVKRTKEEIKTDVNFMQSVMNTIQQKLFFDSKLNKFCSFCDYALLCDEYKAVMATDRSDLMIWPDIHMVSDVKVLMHDRERVDTLEKLFRARKQEIDNKIKLLLRRAPDQEMRSETKKYKLAQQKKYKYPKQLVYKILAEELQIDVGFIMQNLTTINPSAIKSFLKRHGRNLGEKKLRLLSSRLQSLATVSASADYVSAR